MGNIPFGLVLRQVWWLRRPKSPGMQQKAVCGPTSTLRGDSGTANLNSRFRLTKSEGSNQFSLRTSNNSESRRPNLRCRCLWCLLLRISSKTQGAVKEDPHIRTPKRSKKKWINTSHRNLQIIVRSTVESPTRGRHQQSRQQAAVNKYMIDFDVKSIEIK